MIQQWQQWWYIALLGAMVQTTALALDIDRARREFPLTDFSIVTVDVAEISSGGPPRDGIPAIDSPSFVAIDQTSFADDAPVIVYATARTARAYPLAVLLYHEIVNDTIDGVPIAVTYCPLCNTAIVFSRQLPDGVVVDFGTTGRLRHSDLVMYDRHSESWWQQYGGNAIIGTYAGTRLTALPSQTIPLAEFRRRYPDGEVLQGVTDGRRPYGRNPYGGYDSSATPFLYRGHFNEPGLSPLEYLVQVGNEAWPLALVRARGEIVAGDLHIRWQSGMRSVLDSGDVAHGRELGFVDVSRNGEAVVYQLPFAFAFRAFLPNSIIHRE